MMSLNESFMIICAVVGFFTIGIGFWAVFAAAVLRVQEWRDNRPPDVLKRLGRWMTWR